MVDFDKEFVAALKTVLPNTLHELTITGDERTPAITYQELNNYDEETGDTIGYSKIIYQVKVWHNNIGEIKQFIKAIDKAVRPLGFKRTNTNELHDRQSSMIQKILQYEAKALEHYTD